MNSQIIIQFVIVVLLILLSAFFSSAETAMTTVNRIHVQSLKEQGLKSAIILDRVISDPGKMLSTILIGNNIVNMAVSALVTTLTIHIAGNQYVGAATGLLTLLILLFGEISPKTLASFRAERLALLYARPIYALMTVLTPVIFVVDKLAGFILMLFHTDPKSSRYHMTEHELRTLVNYSEKEGVIENEEKKMIYNVFDFGDSTAREVMVPRINMTFVDVNATYEELLDLFREDLHTRFPVFEETTDNIIGIINMKDLILYPESEKDSFSIRGILREAYFTYEYKKTADLLLEMRKASVSLAIVLDEYGSTAGLVTLEDLLEEIVGEIHDEYDLDEEEDIVCIQPMHEYLVSGSVNLNDLNEQLELDLSSEDYDTIGGFIIEKLDALPALNQTVTLEDGTVLIVDKIDNKRIETVRIRRP